MKSRAHGFGLFAAACVAVISTLHGESGAVVLEGSGIKAVLDGADGGFGILELVNKRCDVPVSFGRGTPGKSRLWNLEFWRDGNKTNGVCSVDNLAPSNRRVKRMDGELCLFWEGISLEGEEGCIDVAAKVTLSPSGDAVKWRLGVRNRSARWGLSSTEYPIVDHVVEPGKAAAFLPLGILGGRLIPVFKKGMKLHPYPSGSVPVQTMAFFVGDAGMQMTALDDGAQEKVFDTRDFSARIWYRCPDEGRPGAANAPDYAVETAAFKGDWWCAAKRYRAWALRQKWTSKGPLASRSDFSRRLADTGYIVNWDFPPEKLTNIVEKKVQEWNGIPIGIHWYCWHKIPFDHSYPEYFPEKAGAVEASGLMRASGVLAMPYINGRLWDSAILSFTNAYPAACKMPDGKSLYIERYAKKRPTVPMCPTTEIWREKLRGICERLTDHLGATGIYFDQIAQEPPAPCHDPAHGHPLGGGRWWVDGYRELMRPIREKASAHNVPLTTECAAEPYMDSVDGFLVWLTRSPHEVPFLPAVYSGYTIYWGTPQDVRDTLDSYCAFQGREFLWGILPGWHGSSDPEKSAFLKAICRERLANKDYLVYGELVGNLETIGEIPKTGGRINKFPAIDMRVPAIMGTVWRNADGTKRRAFVVNVSGQEQTFSCRTGTGVRTMTLAPRYVSSFDFDGYRKTDKVGLK